jgi:hypothetical protein
MQIEEERKEITIRDPYIVDYYNKNKHLDIETVNRVFIELLKKLSLNLYDINNESINKQILTIVSDLNTSFNNAKNELLFKMQDHKKDYINDIKEIITNRFLLTEKEIETMIGKSNENLINKTSIIISDIVPKNQDKITSQIEAQINSFCTNINNELSTITKAINTTDSETNIKQVISTVENEFNKMIVSIQQPIFSIIQTSEERTTNGIGQLKDTFNVQQTLTNKLSNELSDFLNKYKNNSSIKGNVSEVELYYILQRLMPTDEIINVSNETASCDFKVIRKNISKPIILFENKDYARSVNTEEVKKFERDLQTQRQHGIFLSQNSPITFKDPFQIDIINGLIHIYIPYANYDVEKIKIGIDIIDSLSIKINAIASANENKSEIFFTKLELEQLIDDYKIFAMQKSTMIDSIKLFAKQMAEKLDEMQLPNIKRIFTLKSGSQLCEFKCTFCNVWSGKNKASLGAHIRTCKFNPKNKDAKENNNEEE